MSDRPLSPIEHMIDRACGFEPSSKWKRLTVTLKCPLCGRTKKASTHKSDPPNTAVVVATCNTCPQEDNGLINYFDAAGRQLDLEGLPMFAPTQPEQDRADTEGQL